MSVISTSGGTTRRRIMVPASTPSPMVNIDTPLLTYWNRPASVLIATASASTRRTIRSLSTSDRCESSSASPGITTLIRCRYARVYCTISRKRFSYRAGTASRASSSAAVDSDSVTA